MFRDWSSKHASSLSPVNARTFLYLLLLFFLESVEVTEHAQLIISFERFHSIKLTLPRWHYNGHLSSLGLLENVFSTLTLQSSCAYETIIYQFWFTYSRSYLFMIISHRLQLSALMYERGTEPINSALAAGHAHGISPSTANKRTEEAKLPSLSFSEQINESSSLQTPAAAHAINDKLHNNIAVSTSFFTIASILLISPRPLGLGWGYSGILS